MKKTLFTLFTAISLALLYCPAALALTEDEAAAAVDAQGKDAVSGNLFLWLLCFLYNRLLLRCTALWDFDFLWLLLLLLNK